jgi:hypothetical protein
VKIHPAGIPSNSPSLDEITTALGGNLYQLLCNALQIITIGHQARSEAANFRYTSTIELQKHQRYVQAYKALHELHKSMTAELKEPKEQKSGGNNEYSRLTLELEQERQSLIKRHEQEMAKIKEEYQKALVSAGNRIQA